VARFESLDDFHPDALFANLSLFEAPRRLRAALMAPTPAEEDFVATEQWLLEHGEPAIRPPSSDASVKAPPDDAGSAETVDATMERLLGGARVSVSPRVPTGSDVADTFIASVVRPHFVPDVSARRAVVLAALDLAGLPAHTFDDEGQSRLVPPTEVALSERAGLALVSRRRITLTACDG
jgi:type VI secretion system protein ImpC